MIARVWCSVKSKPLFPVRAPRGFSATAALPSRLKSKASVETLMKTSSRVFCENPKELNLGVISGDSRSETKAGRAPAPFEAS